MRDFSGKLAVITGGASGMGRQIARQLAAEGCDVAICDLSDDNMAAATAEIREESVDVKITSHHCDVGDEEAILRFRDEVVEQHETDRVNLVFNNAGISGGGSLFDGSRESWDRTFNICWGGVYWGTRAFLPLLQAADEGHIINTSSVNGFWASLGPDRPHTAYSSAKFAVKGFTESLIIDLRIHAPHIGVSLVMPGHIGTSLVINSGRMLGSDPKEMSDEDLAEARENFARRGFDLGEATNEQIRQALVMMGESFRNEAPMTAAEAAKIILDGVRDRRWRILVGEDARILDELVRSDPEGAYGQAFMERLVEISNWGLGNLGRPGADFSK